MIVADLETSGLSPTKNGIWQIGAVDFYKPENTFFEEGRIDENDEITETSLLITGKTEEYLRDSSKQSQKSLLESFFSWAQLERKSIPIIVANSPQDVDYSFLKEKSSKYGLRNPFSYRVIDLHTAAQIRYHDIHNKFFSDEDSGGMSLVNICDMCGIPNKRMEIGRVSGIVNGGSSHTGLEDAMVEAECLSRIIYGKGLLPEFTKYEIPGNLRGINRERG